MPDANQWLRGGALLARTRCALARHGIVFLPGEKLSALYLTV
jgi:hypothetical protein